MAWNEPGNRGGSPWGRKRPAGKSGGLDEFLRQLQQKVQAALGGSSGGTSSGGGAAAAPGAGGFGWVIVLALLGLWLVTMFHQINASDRGVVQRFGRYSGLKEPGFRATFPWPIERVTKVNVSQVNSVEYRSRVLTADVNLVEVRTAIQYQNTDPVKVLFQVKDVERTLAEVSESAIREVVGQAGLDEVLGAARQRITDDSRVLIQRTLDSYNSGVRVTSVNLTDVQVPDAVVAAQRDANKAIEDKERFSMEAQAYANDILPNAQGEAQRLIQNAEGYKAQVVAQAEGDVARFNSVYAAYARAPEVTRQRMYIETIEYIMAQSKKVILDTKGGAGGNMIYLPLDRLLEQQRGTATTAPRTTPPATSTAEPIQELPPVTVDGRNRAVR